MSFEVRMPTPTPTVAITPSPDPSMVAADIRCATELEPLASGVSDLWMKVSDGVTYEAYSAAMTTTADAKEAAARLNDLTPNCIAYRGDLLEAYDLFDQAWTLWTTCEQDPACVSGDGPSVSACSAEAGTCEPIRQIDSRLSVLWDRVDALIDSAMNRFYPFYPPGMP